MNPIFDFTPIIAAVTAATAASSTAPAQPDPWQTWARQMTEWAQAAERRLAALEQQPSSS